MGSGVALNVHGTRPRDDRDLRSNLNGDVPGWFGDRILYTMNKEEMKRQHEYTLMEFRMGEQRIIDELKEHVAEKYGRRITSLEHFKTYVHAVTATVILLIGWVKGHK